MQCRPVLTVCMVLGLALATSDAWGQGGRYGGGVVAPGSPAVTLTGTSGGPRQANSMGSHCRGSIAATPDHVFSVTTPMPVRFEVLNARGDTTLVVVGPSGVLCDDDGGNGFNPRIIQNVMPGQYQVYVGSYSSGSLHQYTLQVAGQGGPAMPVAYATAAQPTTGGRYGGAVLAPGSMFANLAGQSGGALSANSMGPGCRGYIANIPDHVITVSSPMVVTFDINASGDTTLVVAGPSGVLCDDDGGNGFNPRLTGSLQPGVYQIYVGSYSSGRVYPYSMSIHP